MDELFQELNINKKKYILIYYQENDNNNLFLNKILKYEEFLEYKIILLYKNKKDSNFNNERLIELIYDNNVETYFLEEPFSIFYITNDIPSQILIDYLKNNDEIMFFYKENYSTDFFSSNEIAIQTESKNINDEYEIDEEDSMNIYNNTDKNIFIDKYECNNEKKENQQQTLNILMQKTKNDTNAISMEDGKLHIITFFREFEENDIMNSIQIKCIIENINNKDVKSIIIIGKNLKKHFSTINVPNKEIIFLEYDSTNISYSYLFNKANELYNNKIVCIVKADIVIPNQDNLENIEFAAKSGVDRIEFYTGPFAEEFPLNPEKAIKEYVAAAKLATELGLGINAGHDLSLENLKFFKSQIPELLEVSIGHALISDALYFGLENTIQRYKFLLL